MTREFREATKENIMDIMPMGDYYEWHCDWCDSRNLTLWTRFNDKTVSCGACHQSIAVPVLPASVVNGDGYQDFRMMSKM